MDIGQEAKICPWGISYSFQPAAIENHHAFSSSTIDILNTLGRCILSISAEERETCSVSQSLYSVSIVYCCTTILLTMIRTSSHSNTVFNFSF